MSHIQSIDTPYFLTKQTANLQEDFGREIKNSASLFLLYGEEGVGKTRLLKELVSTRLNKLRVHWIDCKESEDEAIVQIELSSALEHTLDSANIGDVVVADHFELATNKIKHQLLQSWSTDGIDKKFSLIIATGHTGFDEVRDLAMRYQLNVKSFQLLPLNSIEIDDYCASTLFPSLAPSSLLMPKQIRLALKETQGVFSKLLNIIEQHRNHISMQEPSSSQPVLKPLLVIFGLTILLILAGLTYYFIPATSIEPVSLNIQEEVELVQSIDKLVASVPIIEKSGDQILPIPELKKITQAPVIIESVIPELVIELAPVEKIDSPLVKPEVFSETQKVEINKAQKIEPVKNKKLVDLVGNEPYSDWFKKELKRSRSWLENNERSRGTIQIMSIGFDSATDGAYRSYVGSLQKKGVDVSQLRVYPTRVREKIVFGIIFGDYESRRMASQSVTDLPLSLGANQPISRSIGSIWNEISQL